MKLSSSLLSKAAQIRSTTIEAPNTRALVFVVGRQNQNTTAATPAMPLMIMMTVRFMALTLAGLSETWELDGTKETGCRSTAPHFLQKISPVPAEEPHWEQVVSGVLVPSIRDVSYAARWLTLTDGDYTLRIVRQRGN